MKQIIEVGQHQILSNQAAIGAIGMTIGKEIQQLEEELYPE